MMLIYISPPLKRRKHEIQTNDIPKLQEHANQTGNQMDIQAVADMEQFVRSFR